LRGVEGYPQEALDADHGGVVLGLLVVLERRLEVPLALAVLPKVDGSVS